jgi:SAM-dependent methyltransferase
MSIANCQCKICGNAENNQVVVAREMMFGFRDEFKYFKCFFCGCLQIAEYPKDISKYYPSENYYSYQTVIESSSKWTEVKYFAKRMLFNLYWRLNIPLLNLPCFRYFSWLNTLRKVHKSSAILDIGCGTGRLLQKMSFIGFNNLTGIDPFIEKTIMYQSGVKILKTDIDAYLRDIENQTNKTFDLIMLHHSFEHMANPRETLIRLYMLLSLEGQLLIRIPVSDSFAWRKYGIDWFQLDAPRHFFLYTTKSIAILAKDCGFTLKRVIYDSLKEQFLCSEKYCRDITLNTNVEFSPSYVRSCKKQAIYLNKLKDGDQACFVLEKTVEKQ